MSQAYRRALLRDKKMVRNAVVFPNEMCVSKQIASEGDGS